MQKLWCLSFENFKEFALSNGYDKKVPDNVAVISIVNTITTEEEIYHICEGDNVLNLDFDDIDPLAFGFPENIETYVQDDINIHFFTDKMADKAVEFILRHKDKDFYIHCAAGISRSQAFIKFIKNIFDEISWETNPNNPCQHPNGFVFQKLMNSYRCRNFKIE